MTFHAINPEQALDRGRIDHEVNRLDGCDLVHHEHPGRVGAALPDCVVAKPDRRRAVLGEPGDGVGVKGVPG